MVSNSMADIPSDAEMSDIDDADVEVILVAMKSNSLDL